MTTESNSNVISPLFKVLLDCPVCKQWGLEAYQLRAKSMVVRSDPFLAPLYLGTSQFAPVNYLLASVTICHRCLFASPDKKDFIVYDRSRKQSTPSQIPANIISDLQDFMAIRISLWECSGEKQNLFKTPRSNSAAVLSYMLADLRAEQETKSRIPCAWFKRGCYWTRIALLQRQQDFDDTPSLEKALHYMELAFLHTDFPTPAHEYQTCYVLFALNLRLNKIKQARDYLGVLEKAKKELEFTRPPDAGTKLGYIKVWMDATRNLWENREREDLWKLPGPTLPE